MTNKPYIYSEGCKLKRISNENIGMTIDREYYLFDNKTKITVELGTLLYFLSLIECQQLHTILILCNVISQRLLACITHVSVWKSC